MSFKGYRRRDLLCALALTLAALVIALGALTRGLPYWGDDHAAYISEGIAIADGRLEEQAALNYRMHPSPMPKGAEHERLVYAWGYPLMLSAVYRAAGFDRTDYTSIIWYKLPLAICYGLIAGILYLWMRRRFSAPWAAFIAALFMGSGDLYRAINILYSDLPFLLFSVLTLILSEAFSEDRLRPGRRAILAALYGAAMWYTRELRLNGTALCAAAAIGHGLWLVRNRREWRARKLWVEFTPYLVLIVLAVVSERLILAPATSNTGDLGWIGMRAALDNLRYYAGQLYHYLDELPGIGLKIGGFALAALCAVGIASKGLREELYLTVLLAGTLIVNVLLPYRQGLRYLYNVLPILLLFTAHGGRAALRWLRGRLGEGRFRPVRIAAVAACAAVLALSVSHLGYMDIANLRRHGQRSGTDVYAPDAVAVYRYIQENLEEDACIAFFKPRALYLNTGRLSRRPDVNGFKLSDADYWLLCTYQDSEYDVPDAKTVPMEPVYSNDSFALSRILH